ncbi:MAG TPA: excinuclease ABC subunit UvrA [Spirochaetaceae bacterium]|nr:excinuclease ABC subunit UvrA [Spirochaetaceae bacterium]
MSKSDYIRISKAREHNLKGVDLSIPKNTLTVISGLSGSGKTSLAFDTICAEGQRRYMQSLSSYARMFLGEMKKADVESIEGLSPTISIAQKTVHSNPRSTVGTLTEIYDYYRLLFSKVGDMFCPKCGRKLEAVDIDRIIEFVYSFGEQEKIAICSPILINRKTEGKSLFAQISKMGYKRVVINNRIYLIDEAPELDKKFKSNVSVVIDRLKITTDDRFRLANSIEKSFELSDGLVEVVRLDNDNNPVEIRIFSKKASCPECGISLAGKEPRLFSFNSPIGACPKCNGIGYLDEFDVDKIIPDKSLSFMDGGIVPCNPNADYYLKPFEALAKELKFSLNTPFKNLSKEIQNIILYGLGRPMKNEYSLQSMTNASSFTIHHDFNGVIPELRRRSKQTFSDYMRQYFNSFCSFQVCPECGGRRLKQDALCIKVNGKNISEVCDLSVKDNLDFLNNLSLSSENAQIAKEVVSECVKRLTFLKNVGLEYLTLSRLSGTLSGGEAQRIRLASQIGSALTGVLYVLDEPSIGLHQRDNNKLIDTLKSLRDIGNTVIVVEHDEDMIRQADYIVDCGPAAGVHGGEIVASGSVEDIEKCERSLTGDYLSGRKSIAIPKSRRKGKGKLVFTGCCKNNLKSIDVTIPLGTLTCITGVSGSGKSTLLNQIMVPAIQDRLLRGKESFNGFKSMKGIELIDKIVDIDQSPIGRTPRSNPATYIEVFGKIRELYAQLPESKMRGYAPGRFSFNVSGGRCENCQGDGVRKVEMHFLPDVFVNCEVCQGKRYNKETLSVLYKGKSIADVLDMTMEEALDFFRAHEQIRRRLETVCSIGLGYIKLGESALNLSGGEAQRVKLGLELSKVATGKTLYVLDEPTTGLHFHDVKVLIDVLQRLVDQNNTVVLIEHNLDVIKVADHIIDLGPEGGDAGGTVVATGAPEEICEAAQSHTGRFLKALLKTSE